MCMEKMDAFAHRYEVQSLVQWNNESSSSREVSGNCSQFVASVDSTGCLCVSEFSLGRGQKKDDGDGGGVGREQLQPERSYQALPSSCYAMELGWSGVALGMHRPTQAVVARHLKRDLSVFDGDLLVRSINTLQNPTAIKTLDDQVYLVGETNKLAVYDLRESSKQGCVQCIVPGEGTTCLATSGRSSGRGVGENGNEYEIASGTGRSVISIRWAN